MGSFLNLLPHLVNGITLGLLFALLALGFMLILGLMEQINLAHGSLFALGAYFAYAICAPRLPLRRTMVVWAWLPSRTWATSRMKMVAPPTTLIGMSLNWAGVIGVLFSVTGYSCVSIRATPVGLARL